MQLTRGAGIALVLYFCVICFACIISMLLYGKKWPTLQADLFLDKASIDCQSNADGTTILRFCN